MTYTKEQLITTPEYWIEIIENSLWRVYNNYSTCYDEKQKLMKEINELLALYNKNITNL